LKIIELKLVLKKTISTTLIFCVFLDFTGFYSIFTSKFTEIKKLGIFGQKIEKADVENQKEDAHMAYTYSFLYKLYTSVKLTSLNTM